MATCRMVLRRQKESAKNPPPEIMSYTPPTVAKRPPFLCASNIVLFLLGLMYLLTYIDRVNVSTASNVFEKELNLNKTEVGLVFSASSKLSVATSAIASVRDAC